MLGNLAGIKTELTIKQPGQSKPSPTRQATVQIVDWPAGDYRQVLSTAGEIFRREIRIRPGQTNYLIFQADFT